jgi:phenylalanyl-tRNA synthetase alpha chain
MSIPNITPKIYGLMDRKLLQIPDHPLAILKNKIYSHFHNKFPNTFVTKDDFAPKVSIKENFEKLLIPENHPTRFPSDTYFFDENTVLRTHTTAHDFEMLNNYNAFLISGDVYRRDEIDAKHYPAFHQLEGGRIWKLEDFGFTNYSQGKEFAINELKKVIEGVAMEIFGPIEMRWIDAYFPFTDPSLELELKWQDDWLEALGCGVYHPDVLKNAGKTPDTFGWAFGFGLERWAMKVFDIPDIRLFWSHDHRFLKQFSAKKGLTKFIPFSKYPVCYKDISFWVPKTFVENDFFELVRDLAGDLVEKVEKVDEFEKNGQRSLCYRIHYRSMDRNLTNEEIDELQFSLRHLVTKLNVTLR